MLVFTRPTSMPTSGFLKRKTIRLVIENKTVTLPQGEDVIVGRFSATASAQPDVDLGPFDAEEKGVSRRHIRISYKTARISVIDLSSTNGTWLNDQRLKPTAEYTLHDGDRLRLGKLEIVVKLMSLPDSTS